MRDRAGIGVSQIRVPRKLGDADLPTIQHPHDLFDGVDILKSSRHNVATWNLTTRVMTGDERRLVTETVIASAAGRVPTIAGTGALTTSETISSR